MRRLLVVVAMLFYCWVAVAQQSTESAAPAAAQATMSSPQTAAKPAANPAAQETPTFWVPAPEERWWLPKGNWIYGYAEFDIAPPHNEPDPNLCAANSGDFGGANAPCNAFARYLIPAEVYVRPFGKTVLRRVKIFYDGTFVFGKNVPQYLYTWSWDGIGWERAWGADIYLGRRFDLRLTQHLLFQRFGSRPLGPGYLGPNGPWGRDFTVGVRKYFGNPRVLDEGAK
ncbi:MAG TPA: hypothetical protein VMU45_04655 [Candidatus Eisenbacteria bacterium]|nr:hypothetical protein [Candidatus Eisenbacteria bacterium]